MTEQPTDREDRAFWALLVISQVWAATGHSWWLVLPWLVIAARIRAPYWLPFLKRKGNCGVDNHP